MAEFNKKFKIIFVLGAPGGGKNTQCDLIKAKYKIFHFSCGDLLRQAVEEKDEEADFINKGMKEGIILPARITCSLQKKCMIKNSQEYDTYLCDGFPRSEENLKGFLEVFGTQCQIIGVFFLDCPEEECIKRIMHRGGDRVDDNIESIKKRFKVLREETLPTVEELKKITKVFTINANQPQDKVFKEIDDYVKDLAQKR